MRERCKKMYLRNINIIIDSRDALVNKISKMSAACDRKEHSIKQETLFYIIIILNE